MAPRVGDSVLRAAHFFASPMDNPVQYALRESVAWITMDRPEAMNASNVAMKTALLAMFDDAERNDAVRAIVLTGNGRAFCAGGDRKEAPASSPAEYRRRIRRQQELCAAIWNARKPVIAAVNGHAIGGGLEMALVCDIRLAARSAVFSTPVSRIGSIATGGLHDQLARVIGVGRAFHMVLSGESVDAQTAHLIGLASAVYPDDDLVAETHRLAARIAGFPPASVRAAKRAFRLAVGGVFRATIDLEEDLAVDLHSQL